MRVGIIMPCKASAEYTRQAAESIFAQTHRDFTFLIVDDNADAETKKYLQSIKDPRVEMIVHAESKRASACLNEGLRQLDTEFVFQMHADDIARPGRIEEQLKYWQKNPELEVLGTGVDLIDAAGNPVKEKNSVPRGSDEVAYRLAWSSAINHPTVGWRRQTILKAGGYRESMNTCEDYELWTRLSPEIKLGNCPKNLLLYRIHGNQNSKKILTHKTVARELRLAYRAKLTGLTLAECDDRLAEKDWDARRLFYERMARRFPGEKFRRDLARRLLAEMRSARSHDGRIKKLVVSLHPLYAWTHGII